MEETKGRTVLPESGIEVSAVDDFARQVRDDDYDGGDAFQRLLDDPAGFMRARKIKEETERLAREANNKREEVFNWQIQTLLDKGYPQAAGMSGVQFLHHINLDALKARFRLGDLIVISEQLVSITKKMPIVELNGKRGESWLNPRLIKNMQGIIIPDQPAYLLRDVENGAAARGISPKECIKRFKKQKRSGLTVNEGVMLVTYYPEILQDHFIYLLGSRYDSASCVPCLWLNDGGPELNYCWSDGACPQWGSPSCGSRI